MDNFNLNNFDNQNLNESNPLDKDAEKPIPLDDADMSEMNVSHSPLDLGGSGIAEAPKTEVPEPVVKSIDSPLTVQKSAPKTLSTERIVGVKTFFTKLHPGAMNFLDEQITKWLQENPDVSIKRTNVVTGEIQAKKTEPNIIITVWY